MDTAASRKFDLPSRESHERRPSRGPRAGQHTHRNFIVSAERRPLAIAFTWHSSDSHRKDSKLMHGRHKFMRAGSGESRHPAATRDTARAIHLVPRSCEARARIRSCAVRAPVLGATARQGAALARRTSTGGIPPRSGKPLSTGGFPHDGVTRRGWEGQKVRAWPVPRAGSFSAGGYFTRSILCLRPLILPSLKRWKATLITRRATAT